MPPVPPQTGQEPGHMGVIWVIAGVFVLLFGIWYFAHTQLVMAFFTLKRLEIDVLQFFTGGLQNVKTFITQSRPADVSFVTLSAVANQVGHYLRFPVAAILLLLSVLLFFRSSTARYNQVYTMKALVNKEVENWPQSVPILKADLVHQDINKGPWAMTLTPMQFAMKYKILSDPERYQELLQLDAQAKYKVNVLRDRANRTFAIQLGQLWRGVDVLKPHMKALFAAFVARGAKDADASLALLDQIARSSATQLDFSGTESLLKKYAHESTVKKIIQRHAYEYTVMATLLEYARTDGVLSSSEFLWLKTVDRRLWFMLNTVGRQTAVPEVAGIYAHWIVERKLKRRLKTPMVQEATKALEMAIEKVVYSPDVAKG